MHSRACNEKDCKCPTIYLYAVNLPLIFLFSDQLRNSSEDFFVFQLFYFVGEPRSQPRQSKSVFKNYQRRFWSFWKILVRCGSLWIVLDSLWVVVDRCGWLWVVLGRFGWFLVLVTTSGRQRWRGSRLAHRPRTTRSFSTAFRQFFLLQIQKRPHPFEPKKYKRKRT